MIKKCSKCKIKKSSKDFYSDNRLPSGLQSHCKKCIIDQHKKFHKSQEYKIWRKKNRLKRIVKIKESYKKWQQSEGGKLCLKKYRLTRKNQNYRRKYERQYRMRELPKEKDRIRIAEYRAKKLSTSDNTITFKSLQTLLKKQNYKCKLCKKSLKKVKKHIDHIIPLSKDGVHSIKNIQYLCYICNIRKSNKIL